MTAHVKKPAVARQNSARSTGMKTL
jgi:hypothetical protein